LPPVDFLGCSDWKKKTVDRYADTYIDEYVIECLQETILNEATAMVPDAEQRLKVAHQDLEAFLELHGGELEDSQLQENSDLIKKAVAMVGA
jgi:hypothetical protein